MKRTVSLSPEAARDLSTAFNWYEDQRIGLGHEFLMSAEAAYASICRRPEMHTIIHNSHRKALIKRFPYAIYFSVKEEVIYITGIVHFSRNPKIAGSRIK